MFDRLVSKIPVPDPLRQNYPHFIGPPKTLRILYILSAVFAFIVFISLCIYYWSFDIEETVSISFSIDKLSSEWTCKSIGVLNDDIPVFAKIPSSNLSRNVATGFVELMPLTERVSSPLSITWGANHEVSQLEPITIYGPYDTELASRSGWPDPHTSSFVTLRGGNVADTDTCYQSFANNYCSVSSYANSGTSSLAGVHLYKFSLKNARYTDTYNWSALSDSPHNHIQFEDVQLYQLTDDEKWIDKFVTSVPGHSGFNALQSFTRPNGTEYWIATATTDNNLCDIVQKGVTNHRLFWGADLVFFEEMTGGNGAPNLDFAAYNWPKEMRPVSPNNYFHYVNNITLDVECTLVSDDYCIVDTREQILSVLESDEWKSDELHLAGVIAVETEPTMMLLGDELGVSCGDRWHSICESYANVDALCIAMYVPPYECIKRERKAFFTILSLSFASAQLALTVLVAVMAFVGRRCCKPVAETKNGNGNEERIAQDLATTIEMKKTNETNADSAHADEESQ